MTAEPAPLRAPRPPLIALATAALLDVARRAGITGPEIDAITARQPPGVVAEDTAVVRLTKLLDLGAAEALAIAVLVAVEEDQLLARLIARLQAPVAGSRPMVGLLATAFAEAANGADAAYAEL